MEQIALIVGDRLIYWGSIILTVAGAASCFLFLGLYTKDGKHIFAGAIALPVAAGLSLVCARLIHWYCLPDMYEGMASALTSSSGGYALIGVFAGCLVTACILRIVRISDSLPEMLDCMCLAGTAGIAVGRLASLFNASDKGPVIQQIQSLPWAYPVTDPVSGITEYRLATFMIQAMVAGILFVALMLFYEKQRQRHPGDTALVFILLYSVSQIVLDSTRYDSLYFRSNGFVSIVQVIGALALLLVLAVFSVRLLKRRGFRWRYLAILGALLAALGGAGYMEYYVQRHANLAPAAYAIMSACLALAVALILTIRYLAETSALGKEAV